jgi:hypothetical protein
LNKDHKVKGCSAFLGREVTLQQWIEKRIGGEVYFKKEGNSPHATIHLSKGAQTIVAEKYKKMETAAPPGGNRKPEAKDPYKSMTKEEFFKTLPADELTPEELALHDGILDWLERWPAQSQRPGKPNSIPLLAELAQDQDMQKLRTACMPPKVSLRDWIDHRIGGEVEVRKDGRGQIEVCLRNSGGAGKAAGNSAISADDFFAGLPDDSLTDAEAELRVLLLDFVELKGGAAALLSEALKDPNIQRVQQDLLPPEVTLRQWVNQRIGGEIKIDKNKKGQLVMMNPAAEPAAPMSQGSAADKKEQFFASLPDDSFAPEEEELRDTLLAFLGMWTGEGSPTLSAAGREPEIAAAQKQLLPKGAMVSLRDWIERRIGGEIETMMERGSGLWYFGLRGAVEVPQTQDSGPGAAKRRRM